VGLLGDRASSGANARERESPLRAARKAPANLTPAKRLLKVTGGRALATAEELRAFHDALSLECIEELTAGLNDPDWKVRVRAILGLELVGERYGLQAVAQTKQLVLSLNGAPQASLRTAAVRFYGAIKGVKPGPPTERSAFGFISDEPAVEDTEAAFSFGEAEAPAPVPEPEPAPEGEAPPAEAPPEEVPPEEAPPAEAPPEEVPPEEVPPEEVPPEEAPPEADTDAPGPPPETEPAVEEVEKAADQ
jgi:hypothetical protein